mgnify:CR=1 FL=1
MMPAVESMPRRIRPSERKNAFALYGFMSSMVRRWAPRMTLMPAVRPCTTILPRALMVRRIELFVALDGRIVVGQLDVPVRVLRGLAGLLQVAVEFVEHDVDGFRVGKLFLIELAFVEIVDAADTIPAEQFHPLCHLVAQPGDDASVSRICPSRRTPTPTVSPIE